MSGKFKLQGGPYIGDLFWRVVFRRSKFWRGQNFRKVKIFEGQNYGDVETLGWIKFWAVQILNFGNVLILGRLTFW